jgi:hypothetical protein
MDTDKQANIADNHDELDKIQDIIRCLHKECYKYKDKIRTLEDEIKKEQLKLYYICSKKEGGHEMITEREEGLYGERFTYCKRCGYNY